MRPGEKSRGTGTARRGALDMLIRFPAARGARQPVFCCSLLSAAMRPGNKSRGTGTAVRAEGSRGVGSGDRGCTLLCSGGLLVPHTDVTPHQEH